MRAVQTLAGVGGSDDYRSDFSIRAAPFDHLSVTLDGIPSSLLVHTVHRARDTGSLAMLNSDILEGASVLFGSYPQRYGNRTGSQVDFRMREGSRARQQYRVAVSAIAASAVAEGPLGSARRGSWLVTGRKSYIDWLIHRIDPETTGTFGFVDAQAKAVYDLSPRHTVTGTLVAGRSRWDEGDGRGGLNFLAVGLNRTVMSAATLRSSVGKAAVLTQQVYGVFNRYRNENALDAAAHRRQRARPLVSRDGGGARPARVDDRERRPSAVARRGARGVIATWETVSASRAAAPNGARARAPTCPRGCSRTAR